MLGRISGEGADPLGGEEVVVIVERGDKSRSDFAYKLIATSKTSTMEKEMNQAGTDGYKFVAVMGGLFWTLFALATKPMDLIELIFARLGHLVAAYLPAGPLADLLTDGVIGGIAGTMVFLQGGKRVDEGRV